jgi:uncharacterized repeat protein (TIGR01451 family)
LDLIVPDDYVGISCTNQDVVEIAFSDWLTSALVIGGCHGVTLTRIPEDPIAPSYCGGSTIVTWVASSECNDDITLTRTFTIPGSPVLLTVPNNYTGSACMTQGEVNAAFENWIAQVNVNGGCNTTLERLPAIPTAPDHCGGFTDVTWTVTSECEQPISLTRRFTIPVAPEIAITCPASPQIRIIKTDSTSYVTLGDEFDSMTISDNCGIVSISNNLNGLSTLEGFEFPLGTTNVVWTATGICGGETTCSFDVIVYAPELYVTKTAVPNVYSEAGETIVYTIYVYNNGNSNITDIEITDDLTGEKWTIEMLTPVAGNIYTTTYVTNQSDIEIGTVTNVVVVTGKDPEGQLIGTQAVEIITAIQNPVISLQKTGTYIDNEPSGIFNAGDEVNYSFLVTNNGNVTLTGIGLTEKYPEIDITGTVPESLIPGESFSVSGIYMLTQADIDAGTFVNEAVVMATSPSGFEVSESDSDTLMIATQPMLKVAKSSDLTTYSTPGEVITYSIKVSNIGNVSIFNTELTDTLVTTGPEYIFGKERVDEVLLPGETWEYTASFTVTQADIDRRSITNIARAKGKTLQGNEVSSSAEHVIQASWDRNIVVNKTAVPGSYSSLDQLITYTISVENTGNVTMHSVEVIDEMIPKGAHIYLVMSTMTNYYSLVRSGSMLLPTTYSKRILMLVWSIILQP